MSIYVYYNQEKTKTTIKVETPYIHHHHDGMMDKPWIEEIFKRLFNKDPIKWTLIDAPMGEFWELS